MTAMYKSKEKKERIMIEIDKEIYNEVLNALVSPKMPFVTYRKNRQLAMAEEAIELLLQEMIRLGLLLKSGQRKE